MASDEPEMLFYDAKGKRTTEDKAVVQYLSDDPNRPDADDDDDDEKPKSRRAPAEDKAVSGPEEDK